MGAASMASQARGRARSTRRHARRHGHRLLFVSTCVLIVLVRSMASATPAPISGSPQCVKVESADSQDYLTGQVCPPAGFVTTMGYEPVLTHTPYGWRYLKPSWAGGDCSGPLTDRGPFWDFGVACRTHDYGYDLVRFGLAERPQVDRLLYRDMKASCLAAGTIERGPCKVLADTAYAVLAVGDATGFDPTPVPHAAPVAP